MREILFRGKRKDNGEWVYGYLVKRNDKYYIYYEEPDEMCQTGNWFCNEEIIPETVGQFTGLLDKNGKKIFEGDIVRCEIEYDVGCYPHTETYTGTVMYEGGMFHPLCIHCDTKKVEVLGNSWDDPEEMEELNP